MVTEVQDKLAQAIKFLQEDGQIESDLSLKEVAEEYNISRASVLDTIKQATKKLEEFEETLHLLEKRLKIRRILESDMEKTEILEELERIL